MTVFELECYCKRAAHFCLIDSCDEFNDNSKICISHFNRAIGKRDNSDTEERTNFPTWDLIAGYEGVK